MVLFAVIMCVFGAFMLKKRTSIGAFIKNNAWFLYGGVNYLAAVGLRAAELLMVGVVDTSKSKGR